MKRIGMAMLGLWFGVMVLLVSVVMETKQSRVVEASEEVVVVTETGVTATVDYYLPYPGILPDHPIYFMKMMRDRVLLWLTRNKVERTQRLLLYADKRIHAAKVLVEGNQGELGVTTATKAERYLEQAVEQWSQLDGSEARKDILLETLVKAQLKHEEILLKIHERLPSAMRVVIDQELESLGRSQRMLLDAGGSKFIPEIMPSEEATESGEAKAEVEEVPVELIKTL